MYEKKGIEPGLEPVEFIKLQTSETFIDKAVIRDELGVKEDDIEGAIGDSVKLCMDVIDHKVDAQVMKAE